MPPELMAKLDIALPLIRRDPHYFLPTTGERYLLFGSDTCELRRQFESFFSADDWNAHVELNAELGKIRDDLAPSWLQPPLPIDETVTRFIRPELQKTFMRLCLGSIRDYLDRFGFRSELVKAMYAVTDAFSGLDGGYDTPGTGMNFLVHNMCRLPGSGGTWMIVRGGMGTVTQTLANAAERAGARIETDAPVKRILVDHGVTHGVLLSNDEERRAEVVLSNADPFRTASLVSEPDLSAVYRTRLRRLYTPGMTMKVNLALSALPGFRCLPNPRSPFGPTIHLLPDGESVVDRISLAYRDAKQGRLPEFPTIEWYIHTPLDPSLQDARGRHSAALFVQWVPNSPAGSSWAVEKDKYVEHLLSICDRFAPGTSQRVDDVFALAPPDIEEHFGITGGHIHHVDNKLGFAERATHETPVQGLYLCGAGCHPAGSVIGAAGHNVAMRVLADLGRPLPDS